MERREVLITPPVVIDLSSASQFEADLGSAPTGADIVVDCSAVEFMDSTGLKVLIEAHSQQSEAGGSVMVAQPSMLVRRLLEITDLTALIKDD